MELRQILFRGPEDSLIAIETTFPEKLSLPRNVDLFTKLISKYIQATIIGVFENSLFRSRDFVA